MHDLPSLRAFDPPPNGLAVLRARLATPRRPWWLLAVPAILVALALLLVRREQAAPPAPRNALPDPQIGEGFYWVASTPSRTPAAVAPVGIAPTISITEAPGVTYRSP